MPVRRTAIKENRALPKPVGLHLNSRQNVVTFHDEIVRVAACDDVLRVISRRAKHPHGMVMRQHHVLHGLVGDGTDVTQHVLRHHRCRLGVDDHHVKEVAIAACNTNG